MGSTNSSLASGGLIFREYKNFRGVDFSNRKDEVALWRSPEALNVWRNYRSSNGLCVETRPGMEVVSGCDESVYGMCFYKNRMMIHTGTKLLDDGKVVSERLAESRSVFFVYGGLLYILDTKHYFVYDGDKVKEVEGYVPTTTIGKSPAGNGTVYEDVNLLSSYRKNQFCADGKAKEYFLDVECFDEDDEVCVWINGSEVKSGFTAYPKSGKVVFATAPEKPLTDGQDNVIVQFKKEVKGYRERIEGCTLVELFDNRVFFSGNPEFPNLLWHCGLDDPTYCSDLDYYTEGADDARVMALVAGNNALWVMKEPSESNTTIFYHTPAIEQDYGKIYPSSHSSVSIGCVGCGRNFNDDIVFFSNRGLESVSSDVTTEQVVSHKSTMVDNRLLQEKGYQDMILEEWEGYLLVCIDNKIFLADSRGFFSNNGHYEYEWFYWEMEDRITSTYVKDGVLFLVADKKIYTLTDRSPERQMMSYLCTLADEMGYPQMWKTTNKKGTVVDCEGEKITLLAKRDNESFAKIGTYHTNGKGYFKPRIKAKKFKSVCLRFESELPFALYSCTLEAYIGNVVKR